MFTYNVIKQAHATASKLWLPTCAKVQYRLPHAMGSVKSACGGRNQITQQRTRNPNMPRACDTASSRGFRTANRHHSVNMLVGALSAADEFIMKLGLDRLCLCFSQEASKAAASTSVQEQRAVEMCTTEAERCATEGTILSPRKRVREEDFITKNQ